MHAQPGDTFNLSTDELERFQALARRFPEPTPSPEAIEAVNGTLRALLLERHRAYRRSGLAGIAGYARAQGAEALPDELLRVAIAPDALLNEEFPDFYRALLNYPKGNEGIDSRFYWTQEVMDGHPVFSLNHHFHLPGDEFSAIAVRSYYVSRSYDALQILVGLARQGPETILLCTQRAAGDHLARITRGSKRKEAQARAEAAGIRIVEALRGSGDATPA